MHAALELTRFPLPSTSPQTLLKSGLHKAAKRLKEASSYLAATHLARMATEECSGIPLFERDR